MNCFRIDKSMTLGKLFFTTIFLFIFYNGQAQNTINNFEKPNSDYNYYVLIPDIGISIVPPKYFKPSEKFPGFIHQGSASTITFTREEGTPYIFLNSKKIEKSFVEQGIEFIRKQKIKTNNKQHGILYTLAFTIEDMRFIRLIYITGDYNTIVIVNANYPEMAEELLHDVMLQSIRTVKFNSLNNE